MEFWRKIPRRWLAVCGVAVVILAIAGAGLGIGLTARRETAALLEAIARLETRTKNELASLESAIGTSPRLAKEYLLRACDDGIGIYVEGGSVLYALLEVDLRTLPAADRAMLESGILVHGEQALTALCADYTS